MFSGTRKVRGTVSLLYGFVLEFSDKPACTQESTALVAYPVHFVLVNMFPEYWRWLAENVLASV